MVLFNTFNSTFGEEYLDGFRAAVMARGARAFEHRAVRRGRMTRQIAPGDMLKRIDVEWGLAPPGP